MICFTQAEASTLKLYLIDTKRNYHSIFILIKIHFVALQIYIFIHYSKLCLIIPGNPRVRLSIVVLCVPCSIGYSNWQETREKS